MLRYRQHWSSGSIRRWRYCTSEIVGRRRCWVKMQIVHAVFCDRQSVVCIFVHADKLLLCGMVGNRENSLWDGGWMCASSTAPLADIMDCPLSVRQQSPYRAAVQSISWLHDGLQYFVRKKSFLCRSICMQWSGHLTPPTLRDSLLSWSQHHLVNGLTSSYLTTVCELFTCIRFRFKWDKVSFCC